MRAKYPAQNENKNKKSSLISSPTVNAQPEFGFPLRWHPAAPARAIIDSRNLCAIRLRGLSLCVALLQQRGVALVPDAAAGPVSLSPQRPAIEMALVAAVTANAPPQPALVVQHGEHSVATGHGLNGIFHASLLARMSAAIASAALNQPASYVPTIMGSSEPP